MASLKKQLKKYPLEAIVWDDHAGPYNHVDHKDAVLVKRVTIGWVVREDEDTVVIASTLDDKSDIASDLNALGKGMILRRCPLEYRVESDD